MAKGDIETVHKNGEWQNHVQGTAVRIPSDGVTKADVQADGRKVEHVIKKLDGTIGSRNSYGNDPEKSKG